jgi:chemotaxis protein methyltransferase CheR
MENYEIGIVETRKIIKVLQENYSFDLSNFALTSLKRRFEKIIINHNFREADFLITRLREDPEFFEIFKCGILVESTEMFRDPSLWRMLRDELLPGNLNSGKKFKIWLPLVVSGEELFSLVILLRESGWYDQTEIIASSLSHKCIERIREGIFGLKKIEVSKENYTRYQGMKDLTAYFEEKEYHAIRDTSLLDGVKFEIQKELFDYMPREVNLIIFRNQMIYYNQTLQVNVLKALHQVLSIKGFLLIGAQERIPSAISNMYHPYNPGESVYRKKIVK